LSRITDRGALCAGFGKPQAFFDARIAPGNRQRDGELLGNRKQEVS
jgi:hypothetical protein